MSNKNILEEALEITNKDRRQMYGPPKQDFAHTAKIASAILGKELTAKEVVLVLLAMKIAREQYKHKSDSCVDIAGYARVLSIIQGDEDCSVEEIL